MQGKEYCLIFFLCYLIIMLKGPFLEKDFIGANTDYDTSDIVLIGMPYDCTCSNRPGTRFAPQQIRVESVGIETYSPYFAVTIVRRGRGT